MSGAALLVRDLAISIGTQTVLRQVDLEVAPGAIVCLLGSNGVGKTTLMRAVSGIYRNATGRIVFDGHDILNRPAHEIVRLGISQAPEGRHIFPTMTVEETLRVGAMVRRGGDLAEERERVFSLFPVLRERRRQKAGSLSGGEQQMLCIARALMSGPKLLLLDEPSLGLAPMVVRVIFDLIGRIREAGTGILLVEQNARAALRVADYAYVMEGGRIALAGPAAEIAHERRVVDAYLGGERPALGPALHP